jgi:dienelactone hydrolase
MGTMDLISGLRGDSANYNDIVDRLRRRNVAVCVPQLMLWGQNVDPPVDHLLDRRFRHLGGSLASLELLRLRRIIDCLAILPEIDSTRIGMAGLSYGGMFTLYLAALDPRVKSALVSCFFNDRFRYNWEDMVWSGAANHYLDPEVAAMVCPRPLWIENGLRDDVFEIGRVADLADEVAARYDALGLGDRFHYAEWNMGHEFHSGDDGIDFLLNGLGERPPASHQATSVLGDRG